MQTTHLNSWGNSQAVRIPKSILEEAKVERNETFNIKVDKNKNIILEKKKKPQTIEELFEGFDYKKYWADWEKENPGKSVEYDWGKPQGRELL
ncbi:MAG: AbrB/MazE/SpoVT family DNA-binding domain-containing protein [Bacilli bacterium]|nr:AbrB/MazE/SpoVT family DNA-binding domain-containing protein [Bacilli bacterium]